MSASYLKRLIDTDLALDRVLPSNEEVEAVCVCDGEKAIEAVNIHVRRHLDTAVKTFWSGLAGIDLNNHAVVSCAFLPAFKSLADSVHSEVKCLKAFSSMLITACRTRWKSNETAGHPQPDASSMTYILGLRVAAEKHQSWALKTLSNLCPQGITLNGLIQICFLALMNQHLGPQEASGDDMDEDRDEDVEMRDSWQEPGVTDLKAQVADFASSLVSLGLHDSSLPSFITTVKTRVREKTADLVSKGMDQGVLAKVTDFVLGANGLLDFVSTVTASMPSDATKTKKEWRQDLSDLVYESVGMARIKELFEVIVDYPDSLPAAEDLARCYTAIPTLRRPLTDHLQSSISNRLLHPGAAATSIITTYINMIRTLSCVDPSGSLL